MFYGSEKLCNAPFLHDAADWKVRAPFAFLERRAAGLVAADLRGYHQRWPFRH